MWIQNGQFYPVQESAVLSKKNHRLFENFRNSILLLCLTSQNIGTWDHLYAPFWRILREKVPHEWFQNLDVIRKVPAQWCHIPGSWYLMESLLDPWLLLWSLRRADVRSCTWMLRGADFGIVTTWNGRMFAFLEEKLRVFSNKSVMQRNDFSNASVLLKLSQ